MPKSGPGLSMPNRELLERLGAIALRLGTRSFLVGGPVRDLLLKRESPDLDVAVEEGSREFGTVVARELEGRFVFHARFLTGTIIFGRPPVANRQSPIALPGHIDVSQTRAETYERPAVLPAVRPASIVGDLGRRDFTVNSMALEITPGSFGAFIDPFDGRVDVTQRLVRVLHARSFIDDPTRIFRCIRFATRFGFAIEARTLELMRAAIEQRLPAFLTPERILYELSLICGEPLALRMVEALLRENVLGAAWRWTAPRGFLTAMKKVAAAGRADLLYIHWLSTLPLTDRFPVRRDERDAAGWLGRFAGIRAKLLAAGTPSAIFRLLRPVPEPALRILARIEPARSASRVSRYLDGLLNVRITATGADLRALGVKPGPVYGKILDKLLFARLDGKIASVQQEQALLRRLAARAEGR
jgi:tRNA nucleotidyltransferase (CCA-adding enzyme)